jgi:hypothetical protein
MLGLPGKTGAAIAPHFFLFLLMLQLPAWIGVSACSGNDAGLQAAPTPAAVEQGDQKQPHEDQLEARQRRRRFRKLS